MRWRLKVWLIGNYPNSPKVANITGLNLMFNKNGFGNGILDGFQNRKDLLGIVKPNSTAMGDWGQNNTLPYAASNLYSIYIFMCRQNTKHIIS